MVKHLVVGIALVSFVACSTAEHVVTDAHRGTRMDTMTATPDYESRYVDRAKLCVPQFFHQHDTVPLSGLDALLDSLEIECADILDIELVQGGGGKGSSGSIDAVVIYRLPLTE